MPAPPERPPVLRPDGRAPVPFLPTPGVLPARRRSPETPARAGGRRWFSPRPWWAVAVAAALYLALSGGPAIFDQMEGQYAGAAREMLNRPADFPPATRGRLWRGDWLTPTNDGIPRLQKPPLLYWTLMGSLRAFGTSEFAARLPNALAASLWFLGVYLLGRRLGGERLGAAAALILATMAGTFIFSHLIMPEALLAAFLTLTFWCFASALARPERAGRWMTLAWAFMALGSFSKGLHGMAYPLAAAALAAGRWPRSRPVWRKLARPAGPLLFLALVGPWYAVMEARFPGFLREQFWNEQIGHVLDRRWPPDSERVALFHFWVQHLVFFLPWTLFAPTAWLAMRRARRAFPVPARDETTAAQQALPAIWLGLTALSVLPSSLQDYYTLTCWGAAALWLARPWVQSERAAPLPRWAAVGPGRALAALGALGLAAGWWLRGQLAAHAAAPAALGARATIGERDSILNTITDFPAERWQALLPALWLEAGALLAGGLAAGWLAGRGRRGAVVPAVAAAMALVLAAAGHGMRAMEDELSLKRVALAINARAADADALVFCQGLPADNPSLFFYLNREVRWLDADPAREFASREHGIGAELFLSRGEFAARWRDPAGPPVFLICEESELPAWRQTLALTPEQAGPVARSGTRVALANRPPRRPGAPGKE